MQPEMRLPQFHVVVLAFLALAQCVLTPHASFAEPTIDYDRKLESFLNFGTSINSKNVTLMYVKATGKNDIIHNVWEFTRGTPTFLYVITDLNTTLNITWENQSPVYFNFSKPTKYVFGFQINTIWEFNDLNDTAKFNPLTHQYNEFSTKNMEWERTSIIQEDGEAMLNVVAKSLISRENKRDGIITIKVDLYPYTAHAFDLPHLIHSANSSLIDIFFENVTLSQAFNSSRFAIKLTLFSVEKSDDKFAMYVRKGLDDEHTPGVFEIVEIVTPETVTSGDGGFLQYRPVCYRNPQRDVSSSVGVQTGDLNVTILSRNSVAYEFLNDIKNGTLLSESTIVTMGTPQDGFYKKTNYTLWAFTLGYGNPPEEGFSLFVILVLSIGLGIPILLLTIGSLYVCVKRRSKTTNQPVRLVEE